MTKEQLRKDAHKLALNHDPFMKHKSSQQLAKAIKHDIDGLRDFVRELNEDRLSCTQPAEEWLLDNAEFIESEVLAIKRQLRSALLKVLPHISSTGQLRMYDICKNYLQQTDGYLDEENFAAYVQAYQEVSVLNIAEIWTIPLMLRIAVIRQLASMMETIQERRNLCKMVEKMLANIAIDELTPQRLKEALDDAGLELPLSGSLTAHLVQHLRERADDMGNVGEWLMCKLEHGPESLDTILSLDYQMQATYHVSTGNLINSLRQLSRRDWIDTFEQLSFVEQTLREEALGDYSLLDAASKNTLRQRVAVLARRMGVPENLVASQAVQLANEVYAEEHEDDHPDDLPSRASHVAYYLLEAKGLLALQAALKSCGEMRRLPELALLQRAKGTYFNTLALFFLAGMVVFALWVGWPAMYGTFASSLLAIGLLVLPVSEWAVTGLHWSIERTHRPARLLRYDFSDGIPSEAATMVVIPVIWSTVDEVRMMSERLELHYLANRDPQLHYALLGDFQDAPEETMPEDEQVLEAALTEMARLNNQYPHSHFYIFQRRRKWNDREDVWMGWERKRGKLVEFVELLKGNRETSYIQLPHADSQLSQIKYIITLDADTQLPLESAHRMVGAMHLTYNRPRLNEAGTRVVEGYGVIQPRIGMTHEASRRSRLARLYSAEPGVDPYSFAVFDPYQDSLGEGIFTGKGIFDVEAFHAVLGERIPNNKVLSHDLLEGGFLRAGLLSDIELIDEHPATFSALQKRLHRWVRGDWQLLMWLRSSVRNRQGQSQKVDLSMLTRWQMIDNLRRSLLLPSLMLILLLSVWVLPGSPWRWFLFVLLTMFIPVIKQCFNVYTLRYCKRHMLISTGYIAVTWLTLPYQTIMLSHAIVVTLYRLLISKRRLLEWTSQAEVDRTSKRLDAPLIHGLYGGYILIGVLLVGAILRDELSVLVLTAVLSVLWLLAPLIVKGLNEPYAKEKVQLSEDDRTWLTQVASEIWQFYEDYVTAEDHWLPPDNVQFEHDRGIAHRTSPTNIGMYLTCALAAREFGFITTANLFERIEETLQTIEKLDKWEGHLYNWYDTSTLAPLVPIFVSTVDSGNYVACLIAVKEGIVASLSHVDAELAARGQEIIDRLDQFIEQTNFRALFDDESKLFSLGYHVSREERDSVLYDLMASEARQASFVAIALGQVSVSHWHTLGRTMTRVGNQRALLSWTGTMFEYLMPWLIMRTYRDTVWDQTYEAIIDRQIDYAKQRGVPFGISESGYYAFDYQLNYQYKAFGVPGLGFKRGLEQDLVIAPYAAMLALPYASKEVIANLRQIERLEGRGKYGFYEAIDFTKRRMPEGESHKVVQSFMAHHLGMSMLALANVLLPDTMIDRFHGDKRVKAVQLLLQERVPKKPALIDHHAMYRVYEPYAKDEPPSVVERREFTSPFTEVPEVCVLSNGTFTSVVTNSGSGFSRFEGLAVTRWREDPVRDPWGTYIYIRDVTTEKLWSPAYQPCRVESSKQEIIFDLDKAIYSREDGDIQTTMEVCVSPEWSAELRRITLKNTGDETKVIEVTTYCELALTFPMVDAAHPAFSKLFIRTAYDADEACLLASRRARESSDKPCWAAHTLYVDEAIGQPEFETDRPSFIGRGHSLAAPQAIRSRLSGKLGSVADPVFVMRRRVSVPPGKQVQLFAITATSATREEVLEAVSLLRSEQMVERSFQLAWNRVRIELRNLHLTTAEAIQFQRMMGYLLYTTPLRRERIEHILANRKGQSALWPFGISGDRPIAVVRIEQHSHLSFVAKLLTGHEYLRRLGLLFELVILNESSGGYYQDLQHTLQRMAEQGVDRFGEGLAGVYVIPSNQLEEEDRTLLLAVARIELKAGGPSLRAQLRLPRTGKSPAALMVEPFKPVDRLNDTEIDAEETLTIEETLALFEAEERDELQFYNSYGGFSADGNEYEIIVTDDRNLPAPWINVMANKRFGCIVSELGTGYSWWRNSREFKITPWSNDTVLDPPGEIGWLRDEASGQYWTLTPPSATTHPPYIVKYGFGYTSFQHRRHGIAHELLYYVPLDDPVKLIRVQLRNESDKPRELSLTYYAEWVLGVQRQDHAPYIVTEWDESAQLMTARNHFQDIFSDAVTFLALYELDGNHEAKRVSWTGERSEFIGRNGLLEQPVAMKRKELSRRTGVNYESCAAIQRKITLQPGETRELVILLGCETSQEAVVDLAQKYRQLAMCDQAKQQVLTYWNHHLRQTTVATPSAEMDVLLNGWLLYQTLACRMWARTAFYQAGGAYGYRDQLQDSLALLHTLPELTRAQLLLHAAHQYVEGDVQHWWHEETERGIRTLFTDDLLWLPYVTARYVSHTGDHSVLQEVAPFITSEPLQEGEHERYEATVISDESGTLYEHCLRAIDMALSRIGEHGLPLIGVGDWNDGMNLVGAEGRGESVWLGWFLSVVIEQFTAVCMADHDLERQASYHEQRQQIIAAINEHGWDGQWYRRAFTDSGQWLGSIHNDECRIDAIAQSWSIISGGAPPERARQAMQSFDRELVERELSVIHLLTPPFDESEPSPGYIQGYPPGIRENGAQYTHGVLWSVAAWAMLGDGDKAFELFDMLNPVNHTRTEQEVKRYVGEPYAMAADVYTAEPHRGRAGWTWYTGSSSWMYQVGLESILGIVRRGQRLYVNPCIPKSWPGFSVNYRYGSTFYMITVARSEDHLSVMDASASDHIQWQEDDEGTYIELLDDGTEHKLHLQLKTTTQSPVLSKI